ncbi:hypothetical protein C1H46_029645 [Malus baccata]|uniref:Uncharacterized protein n=1 Tax=Malus baccata TaxID=106549 RepID=A0A540LEA2_MALBA|nr:hypothetical protein C1H46_029645 [Malus baccata]
MSDPTSPHPTHFAIAKHPSQPLLLKSKNKQRRQQLYQVAAFVRKPTELVATDSRIKAITRSHEMSGRSGLKNPTALRLGGPTPAPSSSFSGLPHLHLWLRLFLALDFRRAQESDRPSTAGRLRRPGSGRG